MKVFLSWSGEQSKAVARALREWLPLVVQNLDPWMSQKDLGAGDRWSAEIQAHLAESKFGIICVTPNNQLAPWLNFEAGAISNSVTSAKVVPYVFEMEFADIAPGPLTQFQAKQTNREGTLEVVQALNAAMERPLAPQVLEDTFEMAWPRLETKLGAVPRGQPAGQAVEQAPQRSADDKLDEVLVMLRNMSAEGKLKDSDVKYDMGHSFIQNSSLDRQMLNRRIATILKDVEGIRWYKISPDTLGGFDIQIQLEKEFIEDYDLKFSIIQLLEKKIPLAKITFRNFSDL